MIRKLIALSGIDGSGKSTQLEFIRNHLESRGESVVCLWTRGGYTPGINALKVLIRKITGKKLPSSGPSAKRDEIFKNRRIQRLWLVLAIFDLLRIYGFCLRWWSLAGKSVICDRYLWDTLIDFQILFPKIPVKDWWLWKFLVWCTPVPDRSVLLMIPLELSEVRCKQKYEPFPDTPERRELRYGLYKIASTAGYWDVIDSTRPPDSVFLSIIQSN